MTINIAQCSSLPTAAADTSIKERSYITHLTSPHLTSLQPTYFRLNRVLCDCRRHGVASQRTTTQFAVIATNLSALGWPDEMRSDEVRWVI